MSWEASPLIVDGTRECVRLVAALPSDWTTDGERLVMLVMACDAFERESAPGLENLAAWTGLNRRIEAGSVGRGNTTEDLAVRVNVTGPLTTWAGPERRRARTFFL